VKDQSLLELVDGAYELMEVYKPESPAQEAWKRNWLEKARRAGAGPGWYRRPNWYRRPRNEGKK